jgi:hypothetical protein
LYAISDIPQKFGSKYEMENKENWKNGEFCCRILEQNEEKSPEKINIKIIRENYFSLFEAEWATYDARHLIKQWIEYASKNENTIITWKKSSGDFPS